VARWLAGRVGPTGRVVATDIDPRFLAGSELAGVEVRRHDIPRDLLETGHYDLVHCRALLMHLKHPALPVYRDRCVVTGTAGVCSGTVSRWLGGFATILSRYDEAERHFEHALEMNARIRARIWVAHTQHDYARMLVARDRPGDREKAAALSAQALATAREVGMKPLEAKVVELRAAAGLGAETSAEPAPAGAPTPAAPAVFQRDGDFWTIAYDGQRWRLRDAKGLQYIAHLLRHTGREFHALRARCRASSSEWPQPSASQRIRILIGSLHARDSPHFRPAQQDAGDRKTLPRVRRAGLHHEERRARPRRPERCGLRT
jgi:hypothetical protein